MQNQSESPPRTVAVLAYNRLCLFEFGIAMEAFALPRPELPRWYECFVVAAEPGSWTLLGGASMTAAHGLDRLAEVETIVVPGWRDILEPPPSELLNALRCAAASGKRFLSICSGAFLLAAAGLLDGRRATTHWAYAQAFRQRFPAVTLEPDVLYVDEGNIMTSAGSAAGIDCCLHLIRRDFGARIANHVARTLVTPPHRDGGQAQYVEAPLAERPGRTLSGLQDWVRSNLDQPLTVPDIARRAAMSERTLLRRFQEATGLTPKAWLTRERVLRAQTLLESADLPLANVAEACGFTSLESFRVAFRRTLGVSPISYRRRFRLSAADSASRAPRSATR